LDRLCVNTLRFLSVDAVQKANSGHPGLPLDGAAMAYVLWTCFLKHNPGNPQWFDRDRFVLSAGNGSMRLYSLLHLTGYTLPLEQIKAFRQWGSVTPGHPERGLTPGVETTTGPLGQGFGNGVGMAIAEAHLAARHNRPGFELINHLTYGIVSDGDLMEGVASEAASLAGHLQLGKLIYLYDQNHMSLAAATDLTFTEDCARRFETYGWHTQSLGDGNDLAAIEHALHAAQSETERPSLILMRTHIGYGAPHKQDTFAVHGSPLGEEEMINRVLLFRRLNSLRARGGPTCLIWTMSLRPSYRSARRSKPWRKRSIIPPPVLRRRLLLRRSKSPCSNLPR
jgi:transketolase